MQNTELAAIMREQIANPPPVPPISGSTKRTVISHFYNEEYLLPWWLKHHRAVFDHGIMIDYHSTDRSVEIIRELCPTWEIRTHIPRNDDSADRSQDFLDSHWIDQEVMFLERSIDGWRMTLNIPEFLYGNTDHLNNSTEPLQYFVGNYVFVDMEDETRGPLTLSHDLPLHEQRFWGYDEFANTGQNRGSVMGRMNRSLHNHPVSYEIGRHFGGGRAQSFNDLVLFYYGLSNAGPEGIKRKTQIVTEKGGIAPHTSDVDTHLRNLRDYNKPMSRDLRPEIAHILEHNRRLTNQNF